MKKCFVLTAAVGMALSMGMVGICIFSSYCSNA